MKIIMKSLLMLSFVLSPLLSMGQEMTVDKFEIVESDQSAQRNIRLDGNETPCALIKVIFPVEGAEFEGNVVGDVEYRNGTYYVYLTEGSKSIKILHPSYHPLSVWFGAINNLIKVLKSAKTYTLSVNIPQIEKGENATGNFYSFDIQPAMATLKIGEEIYKKNKDGKYTGFLEYGNYNYIIEAPGYDTETGSFTIAKGSPLTKSFSLVSQIATLSIDCADKKTEIYINNEYKGVGSYSSKVDAGEYLLELKREHYRPISEKVQIAMKEKKNLHFNVLEGIFGNIIINNITEDVEAYIDGDKINNLLQHQSNSILTGEHMVIIKKKNGESKSFKVFIEEGKPVHVDVNLLSLITFSQERLDLANKGNAKAQFEVGKCYQYGYGVQKNIDEAKKWYLKAAEQGNAEAQCALGEFPLSNFREFFSKHSVIWDSFNPQKEKDYIEALKWLRMAEKQGLPRAYSRLGDLFNLANDYENTIKYYTKAIEKGDETAPYEMSLIYALGKVFFYKTKSRLFSKEIHSDHNNAVKFMLQSAERGYADAQTAIGNWYARGKEGLDQDFEKALVWYKLAAEQGDADAQEFLGDMYSEGNGVNVDYDEAEKWYDRASENPKFRRYDSYYGRMYAFDNRDAKNKLEKLYNEGKVIKESETSNSSNNSEKLKEQAKQKQAEAQYSKGTSYLYGMGVGQDYKKALECYLKAAELGNANAQFNIGAIYEHGLGVKKDNAKAIEWYLKSAEQGNVEAQLHISDMYLDKSDFKQAAKWLKKAAAQGDENAKVKINGVKSDASTGNEEAKKLLEELNKIQ